MMDALHCPRCCRTCEAGKVGLTARRGDGATHRQRSSIGRSRVLSVNASYGSATTRMGWSLSFLNDKLGAGLDHAGHRHVYGRGARTGPHHSFVDIGNQNLIGSCW